MILLCNHFSALGMVRLKLGHLQSYRGDIYVDNKGLDHFYRLFITSSKYRGLVKKCVNEKVKFTGQNPQIL